jgi:hypothetical protein
MKAAAQPPSVPVSPSWTTPQILWRAICALWLCDLLFLAVLLAAGRVHMRAISTIGKDAAPSSIASQQIKTALADMDADAANELLADPTAAKEALNAYGKRRVEAATALISLARSMNHSDAEREPISNIQLTLGDYEALIQKARDLRETHNSSFIAAYNQGAALLDNTILAAADALDKTNLDELNAAYKGQRSKSGVLRTLVVVTAALLLAILVIIQLFLLRRTHRLVNVPLFAATLLVVFFAGYFVRALNSAENDLMRAKEDAFSSVHTLWRARAVAYAATADESRFLLDPAHRNELTESFFTKRDLLATLPPNVTFENEARLSGEGSRPGFSGYLADELNNITFPGEREAASDILKTFGNYLSIDARIRELEAHGGHRDAIALRMRNAPGQSDSAFGKFDDAVGRTLKINQDAFDVSVNDGLAALGNFDIKAAVVSAVVAMLGLTGLLQRIREYR